MRIHALGLSCMLALASTVAAVGCDACKPSGSNTKTPGETRASVGPATFRLYVASDIAGALEPCGCVKDQLGGLDHLGALVARDAGRAKASAFVTAGPLFFLDSTLRAERRSQEVAKAETLSTAMGSLGLIAFAPGDNDFAAGDPTFAALASRSVAAALLANSTAPKPPLVATTFKDLGGVRVGFVGVSTTKGVPTSTPADAVARGLEVLKAQGAQVYVVLAATGRGEAKRIADKFPQLAAVIVGSSGGGGEANTDTPAGELVGDVAIVETGNHLQTVVALDFWQVGSGYTFAEASSLRDPKPRREVFARVQELRTKLADAERDGTAQREENKELAVELIEKRARLRDLEESAPPKAGGFFRYRIEEIGGPLGTEAKMTALLGGYYKRVNEDNKLAFASKLPRPVSKGESAYAGIEACSTCHAAARKVWDGTAHANAYRTLSSQFKEFNLDCVSCHVTGYDQPGGSTITHVDELKNVQCEVCHGPGAAHAAAPKTVAIAVPRPQADSCLACHHPPHVHSFAAAEKLQSILGPGHGRPEK
jgi:Cytochrome c554 and c-prime